MDEGAAHRSLDSRLRGNDTKGPLTRPGYRPATLSCRGQRVFLEPCLRCGIRPERRQAEGHVLPSLVVLWSKGLFLLGRKGYLGRLVKTLPQILLVSSIV